MSTRNLIGQSCDPFESNELSFRQLIDGDTEDTYERAGISLMIAHSELYRLTGSWCSDEEASNWVSAPLHDDQAGVWSLIAWAIEDWFPEVTTN